MVRKLIILRGNSGSGKTTVAKLLQEKIGSNTMLISHDMVRMQILHVWSKEGLEKSQPLMIELLKYGKRNSEITIMEGILPSKEYVPLFETAVKEYGENIYSYYWDIPFEETLIRHSTKPKFDISRCYENRVVHSVMFYKNSDRFCRCIADSKRTI